MNGKTECVVDSERISPKIELRIGQHQANTEVQILEHVSAKNVKMFHRNLNAHCKSK